MNDLKDMDGNTVSLLKLCSLEPEWARSRIEILQARVDELEAESIADKLKRRGFTKPKHSAYHDALANIVVKP